MRRTVGPEGLLDGSEIRRALEAMEKETAAQTDPARSQAMFERVMVRLAEQERRHRRTRQIAQLVNAAVAAVMTGAGAYRLLMR
jgi:hypothetical protein